MAKRKLQIEQLREFPKLIEQGMTYKEIALRFGVCTRTVDYWIWRLKNAGIKLNITKGPKGLKLNAD